MKVGLGTVCNPQNITPASPLWSWGSYFDPFCIPATTANSVTSMSPTDPNSPLNPNACYGGGPLLNQSACLATQQQVAAQVAASDPTGASASACANSAYELTCMLGLTDENGNLATSSPLLWGLLAVAGFAIYGAVKH